MENNKAVIPIFFTVDDNYTPYLAVVLSSIIDNCSKDYHYVIKILYTNISETNKKKIAKYESTDFNIEFVDLNYYTDKIKDKLYTRDYYTSTTYFRLFIPELYPQYDKAIYLDSDMVVTGDISKLYNEKLGKNLLGAVPDQSVYATPEFQEYVEKVVGMSTYKSYFNAGMLLMNLDELRKYKFQEKFMYLLSTVKYTVAQDQDYLNRLTKGRVKLLDDSWNVMPLPVMEKRSGKDLNIIHYNHTFKPWHTDNILYEEYFWKYAKRTSFYDQIKRIKDNYSDDQKYSDSKVFNQLVKTCEQESSCVGDDRKSSFLSRNNPVTVNKDPERVKILEKIEKLEEEGIFDRDVEDDPPSLPLEPDDIEYIDKHYIGKFKRIIANSIGKRFIKSLVKHDLLIIKNVYGIEHIKKTKKGAILTCNHFNPYDSLAIEKVFLDNHILWFKKLYKVIREGNYTNSPGKYGFLFKNCDTLPLSSNMETMIKFMKAVETILKKGDYILIYPEQSMWWNYRKPKPLKPGAYKIAAKNNVPIIPIFITMNDSSKIGKDGFPIQEYTINIEEPIYPDTSLSIKERAEKMRQDNAAVWKNVYETFYNIPLRYNTKDNLENEESKSEE